MGLFKPVKEMPPITRPSKYRNILEEIDGQPLVELDLNQAFKGRTPASVAASLAHRIKYHKLNLKVCKRGGRIFIMNLDAKK